MIPPGRSVIRVPILMYHYVRVNPDPRDRLGFNLSVTPADFKSQMDWLVGNDYHPIDFDDLRGYLLGHGELPARPVVITLDDGYRDLYTAAFPILRAHGFKAVSYVVSGFLGSPTNVTREQLLEMDANGIEIASHTVSHVDLTKVFSAWPPRPRLLLPLRRGQPVRRERRRGGRLPDGHHDRAGHCALRGRPLSLEPGTGQRR
jgi:peptidoglycan/xylan/chitin deacetylase (PgdA/CDA1 family)